MGEVKKCSECGIEMKEENEIGYHGTIPKCLPHLTHPYVPFITLCLGCASGSDILTDAVAGGKPDFKSANPI